MPVKVLTCPADIADVAELYHMKRIPEPERQWLETHRRDCPECAAVMDETREFVTSLKKVFQRLPDFAAHKLLTLVR